MTQPEETTAALIARLHEEIKESKAECLQWRKDIDIERAEVARLSRQLESTKGMLAERSSQSDGWFRACKQAEKERDEQIRGRAAFQQHCADSANKYAQERDEQRARAEKAEVDRDKARLGLSDIANQWQAEKSRADGLAVALQVSDRDRMQIGSDLRQRIEAAERRTEQLTDSHAAIDRLLAERTRERDEARVESLQAGLVGREMEESLDAVTAECVKAQDLALRHSQDCDRALKERDEAREQLGRVQADYQVFMLGTAHGAKCWADECGWHCDEGCKAKHARKCVAAHELKDAREQLAKLEWAGKPRAGQQHANYNASFLGKTCPSCHQVEPSDNARENFTADQIGHKATCWFAKKEAAVKTRNHRQDCPARTAEDVAWVDSRWQVNGCRTAPIEGPRPRPIGCDGCECARGKRPSRRPCASSGRPSRRIMITGWMPLDTWR